MWRIRSPRSSSSSASSAGSSATPAAAPASSSSNGSPATAAPSSTRRAPADSIASSSARAAATERGTCTPASATSDPPTIWRGGAGRAGQLLEVEGVAVGLLVERREVGLLDPRAEQLLRLARAQSAQLQARHRAGAPRALEWAGQPVGYLAGAQRHRDQHRGSGRPTQERAEQVERPCIGPVQVVEEKHERLGTCKRFEQPANRAMRAVAVTGARPVDTRQRREDLGELGERVLVEVGELVRRQALQVLVQRIDEHGEGQLALELGCAPRVHEPAAPVGAEAKLGEQAGLADSRLAF